MQDLLSLHGGYSQSIALRPAERTQAATVGSLQGLPALPSLPPATPLAYVNDWGLSGEASTSGPNRFMVSDKSEAQCS